ncbi:SCO family protein [Sphingomonas donggukensis]|uniref:SCO family protein n=1 Tax=Sphingomonas donggukensis TaxID=2949093 RepID=A0ABY4TXK4_9SPHN|nr:SCO family protein [Sphingomonas donggukensis]URW75261.1 SCO family protein [Sphingomonas donggukensis]
MNSSFLRYFPVAAAILLGACNPAATTPAQDPPLAGARIGGAFSLTDQDGRAVTDRDFAGKYRIMYFGYTFCPDVCPVDVQLIGAGLKAFEARDAAAGAKVVPVFVTVDPERDTPAVVKQFVAAFHPRMVGVTGSVPAIAAVAKAYGIYFAKQAPAPGGGYMVDHSRQAYLMGPDGAPIALLPVEKGADAIADELHRWVR